MTKAVFLRALEPAPEDKGRHLAKTIRRVREGREGEDPDEAAADRGVFERAPDSFRSIPGAPFAYWVSDTIRDIFERFPSLEGNAGTVKQGLATADDFRFLRAWWEVDPARIGYSQEDSESGRGWIHFAKGGAYSPYYADVHLVLNWSDDGNELKAWAGSLYNKSHWSRIIKNVDFYFRPGLTWPRRTQKGLSVRAFPAGCVFADKGPVIVPGDEATSITLLAITNSELFSQLVEAQMAFGSYEVGVLQRTPVPEHLAGFEGENMVRTVFELARRLASADETTHTFMLPSLLERLKENGIRDVCRALELEDATAEKSVIDERLDLERDVRQLYGLGVGGDSGGSDVSLRGSTRVESEPGQERADELEEDDDPAAEDDSRRVANLLLWCVGVAYGRWDIRMAKDPSLIPELQGPFDRLPPAVAGALVTSDGLPGTPQRIASEAWLRARPDVTSVPKAGSFEGSPTVGAEEYPFDVAWDGILVDGPDHPRDIVRKVREVLGFLYGDRAQDLEEEAVEILRSGGRTPATLRDWFRNRTATELGRNFFDFHTRRYSKSRRKAPIYWRLCSSPGRGQSGYGVWLYYHRLGDDTLWKVIDEYVVSRRQLEERRLGELRAERADAAGSAARQAEARIEESAELLEELTWFEAELRKVAERGWAPDLDDGVVVNLAPLHSVVPWKEPEKIWKRLEGGEYDWAHLARRYWPERVEEKCRSDHSLAIAHGVEDLFEGE